MPDVRKHDCFEPQGYPSSSAPKLMLFVCGDQFLCSGRIDGTSTMLRIDKRTHEFSVCAACSRPDFAKQMTVSAILGVFHRPCEAFLVVVTEAVFVGMVCGASVYCVRGAKLLPFELQASPEKLSRSDGVSKEATELEHTLSTGGFYFSYEVDLSCQLFATTDSAPGEARGIELGFSDEFCWNRELSEDLRALPAGYQSEWATALIHGSVQADNVNLGTDVTLPLQLKKKEVNVVLIARRSRLRCWPRDSVGLDEEGQSGGLVSVQLILEADILVSSLHVVMGSCPILWDVERTDAGKRVRVKSVKCCRDALLHHVRHLRRLAKPTLDLALLSVERGEASSSSSEDASLRRALDAAINAAERVLAPEEGVLRRGMLEIKSMPQSRNSIEEVERGLKTAGCKHAAQCAVHHSARDVSNDGAWKTRPQHILCRLHGGYGMVEGGSECLSLASTAAAIALLALRNLFSEAGGKKGWCGGVLEQLLPELCQHCANNLHRQATGLEAELEESHGASSASSTNASVASTFAGLTGGRASSLWRKACETVTYLTSSSYSTLLEEEGGGVHMLAAEARSATALQARLRWRQHGRLSARHDALWQQQTLRVMCGSFNCKGKTIASGGLGSWFDAARTFGPDGADIYVIGLQEAVPLNAVNLLMDAGNGLTEDAVRLFVDTPPNSPPHSPRADKKAVGGGGCETKAAALAAWQREIEKAVGEVYKGQGRGSEGVLDEGVEVLAARQLVGVMLFVLIARRVRRQVGHVGVAVNTCRTGPGGMIGNKGAVAVRVELGHTNVVFVNTHMAAHVKNVVHRNTEYQAILDGLTLGGAPEPPRAGDRVREAMEGRRSPPAAHVLGHDHVVYMGDLNYRIDEMEGEEVARCIEEGKLEELLRHDQLMRERRRNRVVWGLEEAPINFNPTYKFCSDSDKYSDGGKGRVPAWTDRILFRGNGLRCLKYSACMSVVGSDHKPVVALLHLPVFLAPTPEASQVLIQEEEVVTAAVEREGSRRGGHASRDYQEEAETCTTETSETYVNTGGPGRIHIPHTVAGGTGARSRTRDSTPEFAPRPLAAAAVTATTLNSGVLPPFDDSLFALFLDSESTPDLFQDLLTSAAPHM